MYEPILDFWFKELTPEQWWKKDAQLDALIKQRFSDIHHKATRCELFDWRIAAKGRLAEIIILDQFSRNIYRDEPQSFAHDSLALALAQEALAVKADKALSPEERSFLYLPFMHSESAEIHKNCRYALQRTGPGIQPGLRNATQKHHRPLRPLPPPQPHTRQTIHCTRTRVSTATRLELLVIS